MDVEGQAMEKCMERFKREPGEPKTVSREWVSLIKWALFWTCVTVGVILL